MDKNLHGLRQNKNWKQKEKFFVFVFAQQVVAAKTQNLSWEMMKNKTHYFFHLNVLFGSLDFHSG
jgi:hypothetical protein